MGLSVSVRGCSKWGLVLVLAREVKMRLSVSVVSEGPKCGLALARNRPKCGLVLARQVQN